MKVLLVNKYYHMSGGAERCVFEWEKLLRAHGHEVAVFSMQHPQNAPCAQAEWFVEQVDFARELGPWARLRAAGRSVFSVEARRKLRGLLRATRPDIAHVHSYCYQLTPSIFLPLRDAGVPVVQTAHEYYHTCANQRLVDGRTQAICERCRRCRFSPLWTRCVKGSLAASGAAVAAKLADDLSGWSRRGIACVVAPSGFMRAKVIEAGWPARRVVHVPNYVDTASVRASRRRGDYVLFLGRLVRHKGPMAVLHAAEKLGDVPVKLAGDGPMSAELRAFVRERGLANVEFLGFRDGDALRRTVEHCRCVVVPSEWYENASIAILEAMAAARPVVAADIGGIGEQVRHEREGLLFRPGDVAGLVACLRRLWDNPDDAVALGVGGRRRVETVFSPETHYRSMMSLFRGLLA